MMAMHYGSMGYGYPKLVSPDPKPTSSKFAFAVQEAGFQVGWGAVHLPPQLSSFYLPF